MHLCSSRLTLLPLAVLSGSLFACAPLPQHYVNATHPNYGAREYLAQLGQCRNENSVAMVTTVQYETNSIGRVNEVQTDGCMTRLGWAPASAAVTWSPPLYFWWPYW